MRSGERVQPGRSTFSCRSRQHMGRSRPLRPRNDTQGHSAWGCVYQPISPTNKSNTRCAPIPCALQRSRGQSTTSHAMDPLGVTTTHTMDSQGGSSVPLCGGVVVWVAVAV